MIYGFGSRRDNSLNINYFYNLTPQASSSRREEYFSYLGRLKIMKMKRATAGNVSDDRVRGTFPEAPVLPRGLVFRVNRGYREGSIPQRPLEETPNIYSVK